MKRKHKLFLKANVISLFFIAVSFISGTLAWFAYTGLSDVATEIDIRAWNIELKKNGSNDTSNNISISLSDISPGMKTKTEVININNKGDTDALVKYSIVSARILDDPNDKFVTSDTLSTEELQDKLSNDYPFHININLRKGFVKAKGGTNQLEVSVSWPFDSGRDEFDSEWGNKAYKYQTKESKTPIEIVLKLSAEQYMETSKGSDPNYSMGEVVFYDVEKDEECYELSSTCLKTFVIDRDNKQESNTVRLVPYLDNNERYDALNPNSTFNTYDTIYNQLTSGWSAKTEKLQAKDILYNISSDINNAFFVRTDLSDRIIGFMGYGNRADTEISIANGITDLEKNKVPGYYKYKITPDNDEDTSLIFNYLSASKCIWTNTEYNTTDAFAVQNNNNTGRLFNLNKNTECKAIPVIIATKKQKNN